MRESSKATYNFFIGSSSLMNFGFFDKLKMRAFVNDKRTRESLQRPMTLWIYRGFEVWAITNHFSRPSSSSAPCWSGGYRNMYDFKYSCLSYSKIITCTVLLNSLWKTYLFYFLLTPFMQWLSGTRLSAEKCKYVSLYACMYLCIFKHVYMSSLFWEFLHKALCTLITQTL